MKMIKADSRKQINDLICWLDLNCHQLKEHMGEISYSCPYVNCSSHQKEMGHISFSVRAQTGQFNCFHCDLKGTGFSRLLQQTGCKQPEMELQLSNSRKQQIERMSRLPVKEENVRSETKDKFERLPKWEDDDFPDKAKNYWLSDRSLDKETAIELGVRWQDQPSILSCGEALVFPSYDQDNQLIYFTGSSLKGQKTHPAQTRRRVIRSPQKSSLIVLCEGVFDLASIYQCGFTVWALLGTNGGIKGKDVEAIKDRKILIMMDGDEAGQQSSRKLESSLVNQASSVSVVQLPNNKDPNDILKQEGISVLRSYLPSLKSIGIKEINQPSGNGLSEGKLTYLNDDGKPISSFIIRPKYRVWNRGKEDLMVEFLTSDDKRYDQHMPRQCWNNLQSFLNQLPSIDLQFHGTFKDIQSVLELVSRHQVPTKKGTDKLGFHLDQEIWLMPKQVLNRQGLVENPKLQYLPDGGNRGGVLDQMVEYQQLEDDQYLDFIEALLTHILQLNKTEVILPILGWFMATPLKPKIQQRFGGFPVLMVSGTRGAGKTSLMKLFWAMSGFSIDRNKLLSVTETSFMLLKLFSASWSIPIVFDEFKAHDLKLDDRNKFTRYLRRSYNGEFEHRGRPDLSSIEYELSSPVAVIGEDSLTEGALLERIIPIDIPATGIDHQMKQAYQSVKKLPLAAFNSRYVPYMMSIDFKTEIQTAEQIVNDVLQNQPIESERISNNLVTVVFGLQQFFQFADSLGILETDIDPTKLIKDVVINLKSRLCGSGQSTTVALDSMIHHLSILAERKKLEAKQDYVYQSQTDTIALRFDSCLSVFQEYAKRNQLPDEILTADSYKRQLQESISKGGYVQEKNKSVRFGESTKRAVILSINKLEEIGIDPKGFQIYQIGEEEE